MATTPKVLLKRSSIIGRSPQPGDLEFGEIALNFADGKIYYKDNNNNIKAFIDSALINNLVSKISLDSADVLPIIRSISLDSAEVIDLIQKNALDSDEVIRLVQSYSLDSSEIAPIVDSSWVQQRQSYDATTLGGRDSNYFTNYSNFNNIPNVLDSADIQDFTLDSNEVINLIDSAHIQARQSYDAQTLNGDSPEYYRNYVFLKNKPVILDIVDVQNIIDYAYISSINVDADTLDGYHAQYFIDKIDSNTAAMLDSAEAQNLIDSAYIQVRARKGLSGGTGVTYDNITGEISVDSGSTITVNRVVADSGEIALLNFDENVYTDIDVPTNLPAFQEGNLFYFQGPDALTYSNSNMNVKIGQDEIVRVYNNTGTAIPKGKVVYITGAANDFPTIALAKSDNFSTVYETQGLTSHTIADNTFGYVTVRGLYGGLNTAAFSAGDVVHVSPDSAGELVNYNPTHPNYAFEVGVVLVSDSATGGNVGGCIQVNPRSEVFETQRTQGAARFDGNVTIAGNLNILGTETKTSVSSLEVADAFIYVGGGDTITGITQEVGTGLNDVSFKGHYKGDDEVRYYVRISDDQSSHDKIQWSFDSDFATLEGFDSANGPTEVTLDSSTPSHALRYGISVEFEDENNHDSGDVFSGFAAPSNVDFGFAGNYNDSANPYTHAGFFRDATDARFKFFNRYNPEPEGTINTTDASFEYGDIQANRIYAALTGNVLGNVTGTVSDLSNHSTTNLSEGTNLYYTTARANAAIDTRVTKSFVDGLNVNADTLDAQEGTYYLDYNNFTNTPNTLDSADVSSIIIDDVDSDFVNNLVDTITRADASLSTTAADQVVDTFSATVTRTVKYIIQMTHSSGYHSSEILLVHDGSITYMTTYADIITASSLGTIDADINGGNVRLLLTPANTNTSVKLTRINVDV